MHEVPEFWKVAPTLSLVTSFSYFRFLSRAGPGREKLFCRGSAWLCRIQMTPAGGEEGLALVYSGREFGFSTDWNICLPWPASLHREDTDSLLWCKGKSCVMFSNTRAASLWGRIKNVPAWVPGWESKFSSFCRPGNLLLMNFSRHFVLLIGFYFFSLT